MDSNIFPHCLQMPTHSLIPLLLLNFQSVYSLKRLFFPQYYQYICFFYCFFLLFGRLYTTIQLKADFSALALVTFSFTAFFIVYNNYILYVYNTYIHTHIYLLKVHRPYQTLLHKYRMWVCFAHHGAKTG